MNFKEIISVKKELPQHLYIKYLEKVIKILLEHNKKLEVLKWKN